MSVDRQWLETHVFRRKMEEYELDALDLFEEAGCKNWDTIIRQGEPGGTLYILRSGSVNIEDNNKGNRVRITSLGEGTMFGELTFFNGEDATAEVMAAEPCVVYKLTHDNFVKLMASQHGLADALISSIMEHQVDTIQRMNAEFVPILRNIKERANRLPLFVKLFPIIFTIAYIIAFALIPSKPAYQGSKAPAASHTEQGSGTQK